MKRCPSCSRHLAVRESTCPFCHASLSAGAGPGAAASPSASSPGSRSAAAATTARLSESSTSSSTSTSTSSTGASSSTSAGDTDTETGSSTSTSTTNTTNDAGVAAYGGPPVDSITGDNRFIPPDADAPSSQPEAPTSRLSALAEPDQGCGLCGQSASGAS
ncbi:MAG: hypothetical protein H6710_00525 [Myxococcales bacterium]|nr:hypothetical protein [Myxococcales bacterium]